MDIIHARCAGLDVHKDSVVACLRVAQGAAVEREVRRFATTTGALMALAAWLTQHGCTQVALEATGVYWKPVWHILSEGPFELVLANAAHIKNVPGRKTDVNDATWIADLLAHGLIRASFVPEPPIQELRALLRTRTQLVREQARHVQRLQKTLEEANIKLDSVLSDLIGRSGRAMLEALIAGETDPAQLARLADRRLKAPREALCEALRGRVTAHHRFLLRLHLEQIDALTAALATLDREVEAARARLEAATPADQPPFRDLIARLDAIPGINALGAQMILSEIGRDMSRFASAAHLVSWAGLCPRTHESAGKRRSNRLRQGAPWLKTLLIQCAWGAQRKAGSYFQAQFRRLRRRRGPKKAICAVAASILTAIYHMLTTGSAYQDLGADHFERRSPQARARRLVAQLADLGFDVQLTPNAALAAVVSH
jgi:transposase